MSGGHDDGDELGKKREMEEVAECDFTPMIDAMFLLLMFNMIAYSLSGGSQLQLPRAKNSKGEDASEALVIMMVPGKAGQGTRLDIRGSKKSQMNESTKSNATLDEVRRAIETYKDKSVTNKQVVIKIEKSIPYRELHEVSKYVGAADAGLLIAVKK